MATPRGAAAPRAYSTEKTSAAAPKTIAARRSPSATPSSAWWPVSTCTSAHESSPRAAAPSSAPNADQVVDPDHVAPAALSARDPLELAELLERVDPDVRVRADADRDPACEQPLDGQEAVAEVGLRRRAGADACAGLGEQVELCPVGVRRVDDRRPLAEAAAPREQLDRAHTVLGEALLDLARLLVGVDVQGQALARCVRAELLEPVGRTRAHGVGGNSDAQACLS